MPAVETWDEVQDVPIELPTDIQVLQTPTFCEQCGQEIDPDTCACGLSKSEHGLEEHPFIPMGCNCYRSS